jgi:VWFA-related protein
MVFPKIGIRLTAWALGIGISVFVLAQETPTFKVDVNVVNVLATVRDRSGRFVSDLAQDDFILEEDGKPQEIRYFSRQTDVPLTLGLLIDTSMSQQRLIRDEQNASYQFFKQVLRPDRDQAFVIKFDVAAELLQDVTSSSDRLQRALNGLATPSPFGNPGFQRGPSYPRGNFFVQGWPQQGRRAPGGQMPGGRMPGGQSRQGGGRQGGPQWGMAGIGTVLFDAVYLASDEILQQKEGRKAIICISDGVDNGSKVTKDYAIWTAHRADTLIYSIRYYDSNAYGGGRGGGGGGLGGLIGALGRDEGSVGKAALTSLSRETGGRMFEIANTLSLKEIYDRIQEELRNQYSLGYEPPKTGNTGFRRISLRTKKSKLEVVTRSGYYPRQS